MRQVDPHQSRTEPPLQTFIEPKEWQEARKEAEQIYQQVMNAPFDPLKTHGARQEELRRRAATMAHSNPLTAAALQRMAQDGNISVVDGPTGTNAARMDNGTLSPNRKLSKDETQAVTDFAIQYKLTKQASEGIIRLYGVSDKAREVAGEIRRLSDIYVKQAMQVYQNNLPAKEDKKNQSSDPRLTALNKSIDHLKKSLAQISKQYHPFLLEEFRKVFSHIGIEPAPQLIQKELLSAHPNVVSSERQTPQHLLDQAVQNYERSYQTYKGLGLPEYQAKAHALDDARTNLRTQAQQKNVDPDMAVKDFMTIVHSRTEQGIYEAPKSLAVNGNGGYKRNRELNRLGTDATVPEQVEWRFSTPANTIGLVIPDLHGHYEQLEIVLKDMLAYRTKEKAENPDRKFEWFFTGDYIDKGPKGNEGSAKIVERLVRLQQQFPEDAFTFLSGNHEDWMKNFLDGKSGWKNTRDWLSVRGGANALYSWSRYIDFTGFDLKNPPLNNPEWYNKLRSLVLTNMPKTHQAFFNNLKYFAQFGDYDISHSGGKPDKPIDQQTNFDLMWQRDTAENRQQRNKSGRYRLYGHTIMAAPTALNDGMGLDIGAATKGDIAWVKLKNRQVQVSTQRASEQSPTHVQLENGRFIARDAEGKPLATFGKGLDQYLDLKLNDPEWDMTLAQRQVFKDNSAMTFLGRQNRIMFVSRSDSAGAYNLYAVTPEGKSIPLQSQSKTFTFEDIQRSDVQHMLKDRLHQINWNSSSENPVFDFRPYNPIIPLPSEKVEGRDSTIRRPTSKPGFGGTNGDQDAYGNPLNGRGR